jgi:hypothetical protein
MLKSTCTLPRAIPGRLRKFATFSSLLGAMPWGTKFGTKSQKNSNLLQDGRRNGRRACITDCDSAIFAEQKKDLAGKTGLLKKESFCASRFRRFLLSARVGSILMWNEVVCRVYGLCAAKIFDDNECSE